MTTSLSPNPTVPSDPLTIDLLQMPSTPLLATNAAADAAGAAVSASKERGRPSEKTRLDAAVINVYGNQIVSKRSVERLYARENEHRFLRHFVKKPQRRSPTVNRGYWLRMQAVEYVVDSFLNEELPPIAVPKRKVVVNLGCGYDPLPFRCLSMDKANAEVLYVDIDFPALITDKVAVIAQTPELHDFLSERQHHPTPVDHVHYQSTQYLALGCDLRDLDTIRRLFEAHRLVDAAVFFTAEVSLTFMAREAVDALIQWAATLPDARFSVLEQIIPAGPHHPFARTMLKYFETLQTPLNSVIAYPRLTDQIRRYSSRGWNSVDVCDLLAFWSNRIRRSEWERIESVGDGFDEWEELYCFAQHYFILYAHNGSNPHTPFHGPGHHWNGGGEYRRYPPRGRGMDDIKGPEDHPTGFTAEFTAARGLKRRFGAAAAVGPDSLVFHGGQGPTSRLGTSVCITHSDDDIGLHGKGPGVRMCHTMTTLPNGKVLLVGGRTSPDKPMKDAWLFTGGVWTRVDDIPVARYRHVATAVDGDRILVYGGRGEGRKVLADWLLWSEGQGWRTIQAVGSALPTPRFSSGICWTDRRYGALGGGLDAHGEVLDDMWRLELHETDDGTETIKPYWSMVNILSTRNLWKRFGGQMLYTGHGRILYVGGISGCGLMRSENEILEVDCNRVTVSAIYAPFPKETSPFLIGHSVVCLRERVVICGGGGSCFKFGPYTNDGIWTLSDSEKYDTWKFLEEGRGLDIPRDLDTPMVDSFEGPVEVDGPPPRIVDVKRIRIDSDEDFKKVVAAGEPALLEGVDIGSCVTSWSPDYLKAALGADRTVVVHVAESYVSFQPKNFKYEKAPFGEFIDAAFTPVPHARLYFRSLSVGNPTSAPASFVEDFPELAPDFVLPPSLALAMERHFSSTLRIFSADVGMWLHYDAMPNLLCHISGRKAFRLYPPGDVSKLSFSHGSTTSSISDIFAYKSPPGTTQYDVELAPGDVLYIPPFWMRAAKPITPCVSIDLFFRGFDGAAYTHGRDVYQNRDVTVYEKGRKKIHGIVADFKDLPRDMRKFYLSRLVEELKDSDS